MRIDLRKPAQTLLHITANDSTAHDLTLTCCDQAKATAPAPKKGLSASRFANDDGDEANEGEQDPSDDKASEDAGEELDHSSSAMSAVRKTSFVTAQPHTSAAAG